MNNLLRTLTESQVRCSAQGADLKLLLGAVKEARRQSHDHAKLSDVFYDSLEGLLIDLRTVTMDNRDAEAFLKPVSKTEVPDYYEVIANPMDLQTMLKKVKQKQYKSKKEFKDDLDLIWTNCFTYNATENHPLRQCASRLKAKAEKLLQNITDWKERADPIIPGEIRVRSVTPKPNGVTVNGHGRTHTPVSTRSPSPAKPPTAALPLSRKPRRDAAFPESSAVARSGEGMSMFARLDCELDRVMGMDTTNGMDNASAELAATLSRYIPIYDDESEGSGSHTPDGLNGMPDGEVGTKRKLNGFDGDRPRKRARTDHPPNKHVVELWWDAMQSDELLGNGLPTPAYASSSGSAAAVAPSDIADPPRETKRKRKKKKDAAPPKSLLALMNNNIRTLRRVRTTHAKFAALQQTEDGTGITQPAALPLEEVEEVIDERPWKPVASGIDLGEDNADDCLHWASRKVLEHAGFQGTSKVALDVFAGVASEYLMNVGRTIRFLCDKFGQKMTAEEIILHTLFESGTTRVYELERYIKDDVIRYGGRLTELEKKLANAYREATTEEAWDDEVLFRNQEDEEEEGELVMGNFADSFGEDFLGLRELGIAAEFGLSSLAIPKKLLKGKGNRGLKEGAAAAKPTEPPPPFPPPPPFVPLDARSAEDQIGLLKQYYQSRFSALPTPYPPAPATVPPIPYPPGIVPGPSFIPPAQPPTTPAMEPAQLSDDPPSPSHAKLGPIGQVLKTAPAAATAKKKKAKAPMGLKGAGPPLEPDPNLGLPDGDSLFEFAIPVAGTGPESLRGTLSPEMPKKTKGTTKKKKTTDTLPPVVIASA
ncbi:hypothetical protein CERSUDRAFT_126483 [Gelatoporia subvermispora B]|uniref:Bromo domain-containing protein n=1 Tax=Ceriporiopsis subvermispora (strain B) TaxID=914234 RepID=M2Q853_CERS8|nr:hypothetical protein CERSUDRAFT_126483 [Gelatoporia subvermispora B]